MESDSNTLLEFLISKGQIPSFSFPLDTTVFAAEYKNSKGNVKHLTRTSRDTKIAISELAPGRQLTINGERLEIGGLYFEYSRDRIRRGADFFNDFEKLISNKVTVCLNKNCGWVSDDKEKILNRIECPVCSSSENTELEKNNTKTYVILKPNGMAPICVPHDEKEPRPGYSTYENIVRPVKNSRVTKKSRTSSGRAKLPTPSINDLSEKNLIFSGTHYWKGVNIYLIDDENDGLGTEFVLLNTGPKEEGFKFCASCGSSLHDDHKVSTRNNLHHRPYILESKDLSRFDDFEKKKQLQNGCDGEEYTDKKGAPIALGLRFRTDIAIFRFALDEGGFDWTLPDFHGAVIAIRDSIQGLMIEILQLMNRELGAGYRLVSKDNKKYVDIYIYDSVSGGAGLVNQLRNLKSDELEHLLDGVIERLSGSSCLESKPCSRACVGCLLDFKNRMDHDIVNRPLGYSLAKFFRTGRIPTASDFGKFNETELDRTKIAVSYYDTWLGDSNSAFSIEGQKVSTPSGKEWKLISPLYRNNLNQKSMRIDYFETYPSEITEEFDLKEVHKAKSKWFED